MRIIARLLLAFAVAIGGLLFTPAAPATAAVTCETVLSTYVDGTVRDWRNPQEIASHHFFVKTPAGMPDMTGLISSGQAQISVNGQSLSLFARPEVGPNTWGVYTSWVVSHPSEFFFGRWVIRWQQWAGGVGCLLA